MNHRNGGSSILVALMTLAAGCPMATTDDGEDGMMAGADERTFSATLTAEQETEEVVTEGSGMATVTLRSNETDLFFDITASGLTGPVRAAHFHNAPAGEEGKIVLVLDPFIIVAEGNVQILGTIRMSDITVGDPLQELLAGTVYINLHTDAFPGGEIRGQVLPPE